MADEPHRREELRQKRAQIDKGILTLLEQRARLSQTWAAQHESATAVLPSSERETLEALTFQASANGLPSAAIVGVFREIHAVCRALEAPVRVVFMGREEEASYAVARRQFGSLARLMAADTEVKALSLVTKQEADFAVLLYETAQHGPAYATLLALRETVGKIIAVQALNGTENEGSERYCVIATRPASRTRQDATALLFTVSDEPGALVDVLRVFAERSVNLRKVFSRGVLEGSTDCLVSLELSGHVTERSLLVTLETIKKNVKSLHVLGSYPL